jgi:hypothetical protein
LARLLRQAASAGHGFGVIKMASAAIFQAHRLANLGNVTNHPAVSAVRDCAKRVLPFGLLRRKEPLTLGACVAVVAHILGTAPFIPNYRLQLAAFIMVCFAGFLRYNDSTKLFCDEIKFFPTHMELFLETRKCRQAREGNVVFVARGSSFACPVALTELLIAANQSAGLHVPLFRSFDGVAAHHAPDAHVRFSRTPWQYSQARSAVLKALSRTFCVSVTSLSSVYGLHSLRSGGASFVAAHDVPLFDFQRHGGWVDARSVAGYVKAALHHRLQPTAVMDL